MGLEDAINMTRSMSMNKTPPEYMCASLVFPLDSDNHPFVEQTKWSTAICCPGRSWSFLSAPCLLGMAVVCFPGIVCCHWIPNWHCAQVGGCRILQAAAWRCCCASDITNTPVCIRAWTLKPHMAKTIVPSDQFLFLCCQICVCCMNCQNMVAQDIGCSLESI